MQKRFINCSACGGCHTGRGGRYCQFSPTKPAGHIAGNAESKMADAIPEKDSPEYEVYLARLIGEEEIRLKTLQEKSRITAMEEQLSRLRLQANELEGQHGDQSGLVMPPPHDIYIYNIYIYIYIYIYTLYIYICIYIYACLYHHKHRNLGFK